MSTGVPDRPAGAGGIDVTQTFLRVVVSDTGTQRQQRKTMKKTVLVRHIERAGGVAAAAMFLATSALAQADTSRARVAAPVAGHEAAPSIRAARIAASVRIDGRLDDAAWQSALP